MKTIKLIPVIILTTMMLGFTACNDNDDDNDNVSPVGSKIIKMEVFSELNIPYLTADIDYSDSKVTGCDVYSPFFPSMKANISISYQGNKIIVSSNGEDDDEGWFDGSYTFTYTLENGRAISCITETPYKGETNNVSYEYNSDGYLSKVIVIASYGGHNSKSELNFIYYENDLIKMEFSSDEHRLDRVISTVTNSTIENKSNFPSALLVKAAEMGVPSGDLIFNSLYMSYLGIFGKTPKHYQSSMTYTVSENYDKEGVAFDYSIDKNGNINSIILTGIGYEEGSAKVKFSY